MSSPSPSPSPISPLSASEPHCDGVHEAAGGSPALADFHAPGVHPGPGPGVLLGLLGWIRPLPRPYLFPVWVSSYQSRQISFLPGAEQDLHALNRGGYISRIISAPFDNQDRRTIQQALGLLGGLLPSDSVVVYVNSRGLRSALAETCAVPGGRRTGRLPHLDATSRSARALWASPAGWKLLVLDLSKPHGETRNAVIDDDVASRVPEDLKAVDDPRRLTLAAAAPGNTH